MVFSYFYRSVGKAFILECPLELKRNVTNQEAKLLNYRQSQAPPILTQVNLFSLGTAVMALPCTYTRHAYLALKEAIVH